MGLVFFLSGHFHILLDYCLGMRSWRLSGAIQSFMLMFPGIILEDIVLWAWRKMMLNGKKLDNVPWLARAVGYVWVVLWMTAVTPVYNFPLQRIERNPTYPIPWSVFKQWT